TEALKEKQREKMRVLEKTMMEKKNLKETPNTIREILKSETIGISLKPNLIAYQILKGNVTLEDAENYFKSLSEEDKIKTEYRKQLCAYDLKKYDK
ncbi:hypothetical protein, partial [Streptococcus pyogenes]